MKVLLQKVLLWNEMYQQICGFLLAKFDKAETSIRILVLNSTSIPVNLKYYNNNLKLELYENLWNSYAKFWKRDIITFIHLTFSVFW